MANRRTRSRVGWRAGLLLCLALAMGRGALADATEIAYDDETSEAGRAVSEVGHGFAVRFTPDAVGDTLLRVRFYLTGLRGDPAPVEIHVWDADKSDLIEPVLATPTAEGWFDVDLSSAGLVLTGDVYVGYVQTSAENHPWLGVDTSTTSDRSYSVPQWTPLLPEGACAMIRVLTQRSAAVDGGLELAYDDGSAETGRGYAVAGSGYAVRFTPPAGGALLQGARLFISGIWGTPAPIEVHVWSVHGDDLVPPVEATPTEAGWLAIDLSTVGCRVEADFFIGYVQTDGENFPWLGIDLGTATGRSVSAPDWNELLPFGANAMIRAVFAKE